MQQVLWSEEYAVGNEQIDSQHKSLFEILNKLRISISNKQEKRYIDKNIMELQHYTVMHFSAEELYMSDAMYKNMDKHILQHDFFTGKIKELDPANDSNSVDTKIELLEFLTEWLFNHVLTEDKKAASFILT